MSAVTKHIETILKENEKLSSLLKEVVDKTAVECLVNGEELYFHDEPPHTKSGLSGGLYDEKEKIEETPYLCIVEVGGASVESILDNNRTIQIYVRMPEDNIERIIREIQKTLDNTYGREMEYQDLIYNYYSFNEIGQPLFLEKTDNVVLYSVRYRAGYTVYEKSGGGSGDESGGEVEDTKWPRIIKEKFLVKNHPYQWKIEAMDLEEMPIRVRLRFLDYVDSNGGLSRIYINKDEYKDLKVNYKEPIIYGKTLVMTDEDGITVMYSFKSLLEYYRSNKMNVSKLYVFNGNFVPQTAENVKAIYRFDSDGKPQTLDQLMSKEVPFFNWKRYDSSDWQGYGVDPGLSILKTCIYKKDAPDNLVKFLKGLVNGNYYQLDSKYILGKFWKFTLSIGYVNKKNPSSYLSKGRGNYNHGDTDLIFDIKNDFKVKEEEDRFLIYYIIRHKIAFLESEIIKYSEKYNFILDDGNVRLDKIKTFPKLTVEPDTAKLIEEIKQEDLGLDFDIELDDLRVDY